ncbi:hypothetical protein DL764_001116 [Monosporascus ibericus]|uniref:Transcription factor domain-containing protein n=1 Tax=Monosporascus ibericus TaxID=155417 RepID=A0A4Q4TVM8_9PEZI|nr:hypothetical protein DL764_001116 [Monosporascus ibericus]
MDPVPVASGMRAEGTAPEIFTERLLHVRLARFWRSLDSSKNSKFDPTQAEGNYERFRSEFLPTLPPAFALEPDRAWDKRLPKLQMQRQLLHMSIFDCICWNFRPLLLMRPCHFESLAPYKQVLLLSQKKVLAMAALKELEAVSTLHTMLGGSHTRFTVIVFHTFEAAVILLCLCLHPESPDNETEGLQLVKNPAFLGLDVAGLAREHLLQAAEHALDRLQKLSNMNPTAASAARVLAQLFAKATSESREAETPLASNYVSLWPSNFDLGSDGGAGDWASSEHLDIDITTDLQQFDSSKEIYWLHRYH